MQDEYKSSVEDNPTGSESDLPITQVNMSNPFDTKIEHLLTNYFSANSDKHDIQQAFIENDILTFDLLMDSCTLKILKKIKRKKCNSSIVAFTDAKLKLVNDVLLYYNFLYQDDKDALVEEPNQWVKGEFRKWKRRGYSLSTATYNASQAGNSSNTTSQTSNVTTPVSKTKLERDAYLSWRQSKQDKTLYPILENDREYTEWIIKTRRRFISEECDMMINPNFQDNQVNGGADTLLFEAQKNHMVSVLELVLQTSEGKRLTQKYSGDT